MFLTNERKICVSTIGHIMKVAADSCQQFSFCEIKKVHFVMHWLIRTNYLYPNAISNIIIKTNPIAKPIVAKLEWGPSLASGMISSTTT